MLLMRGGRAAPLGQRGRTHRGREPATGWAAIGRGGASRAGATADRWWGVAGAALCGLEIRLIIRVPAMGMNPYALAAGIAGCSLAALDVFTTQ